MQLKHMINDDKQLRIQARFSATLRRQNLLQKRLPASHFLVRRQEKFFKPKDIKKIILQAEYRFALRRKNTSAL